MPATGALNRLQELRNENVSNINPAKNQPMNQPPKSAFKDLTNATKGSLSSLGANKHGLSFRTPQIQKKEESKTKPKETIQIFMDDYCTSLPKTSHKFTEMSWTKSINTDKLAEKIAGPIKTNDPFDYELFKDDEFVLEPIPDPEPLDMSFPDLDYPINDSFESNWEIPEMKPINIDGLADLEAFAMDFNDFAM